MKMRLQHVAQQDIAAEEANRTRIDDLEHYKQAERDAKEARRNAAVMARYAPPPSVRSAFTALPIPSLQQPMHMMATQAAAPTVPALQTLPTQQPAPVRSQPPLPNVIIPQAAVPTRELQQLTMRDADEKQPQCISIKAIAASAIIHGGKSVENRTWIIPPGDYWLRSCITPAKKELVDHINEVAPNMPPVPKGHLLALINIGKPIDIKDIPTVHRPWCITGNYHHPIKLIRAHEHQWCYQNC